MELIQELYSKDSIIRHVKNLLRCGVSVKNARLQEIKRHEGIAHIEREISMCKSCGLYRTRLQAVSGGGARKPLVLVVGNAPNEEEDKEGKSFVGESGDYLDKWLGSIGLYRKKNVYVTNIVKCKPLYNYSLKQDEIDACSVYIKKQIKELQPKLIFVLGKVAGNLLTNNQEEKINNMRMQNYEFMNIPVQVSFHPSAVLKNQDELKPLVWEDLKKIKRFLFQSIGEYWC